MHSVSPVSESCKWPANTALVTHRSPCQPPAPTVPLGVIAGSSVDSASNKSGGGSSKAGVGRSFVAKARYCSRFKASL